MATAKKKSSDPGTYTDPQLRDRIKKKVVASDKGGNPGQWSARKAQLVAQEYEKQGGGYKKPRGAPQKSLEQWSKEQWTTSDGLPARRVGETARYLPKKAWSQLTPVEKASTNRKKKEGSQKGEQFVSNTQAAAKARKTVSKKTEAATKKQSKTSTARTGAKKAPVAKRSAAPARKSR